MKTKMILFLALVAIASLGFGQVALPTTTLASALAVPTAASPNQTTVNLTSTSTMLNSGPSNQINTCLYVDNEVLGVTTVVDSTHVIVQQRGRGCGAIGLSARPAAHASGATVWFANTVTNGNFITPAASYIGKDSQPTGQVTPGSSCTASSFLALPLIYLFSGTKLDCLASGVMIQVDSPGTPVLGSTVTAPAGVMTATGTIFLTDTGTAAVTGLTVPHGWQPGMSITIIPGGAFTTTTATNIRIASTAVTGKALIMTWDGAKWDPSY